MFLVEAEDQTFSLKPMNCPESHVHLPQPGALLSRPAAAAIRVRPAPPQRAVRDAVRADPGPPLRHRTTPTSTSDRTRSGRRSRRCSARSARRYSWFGLDAALHLRDAARQGARRPGAVGAGRGPDPGGPRPLRRALQGQGEGRHVLRAQDRHLHRGRARPRVADGDHPGRPGRCCRNGSTSTTSTRRGSRSDPSPSTARSTARSSASSASSSSTSRGAFPFWCAPVQAVVIPIADRHIEAAERAGRVLRGAGPAGRGRRLVQPDAEQDPAGPGAEGAVHAGPRRPRDRGAHRIAPRPAAASSSQPSLGGARRPPGVGGARATGATRRRSRPPGVPRPSIVGREGLCYPPASAVPGPRVAAPVVGSDRYRRGETISRDLRVNQMIRIPQVRVVDEEGDQLGVMPTPRPSRWRRSEAWTSSRWPRWRPRRSSSSSTSASTSTS